MLLLVTTFQRLLVSGALRNENKLLPCILAVYHDQMRKEITEAEFVAVMAHETTELQQFHSLSGYQLHFAQR